MSWARSLDCCVPTSFGSATVHSPACKTPEKELSLTEYEELRARGKTEAERFNAKAQEAAMKHQAVVSHPAGKGPRFRASQLWIQCICHIPMANSCPVHGPSL